MSAIVLEAAIILALILLNGFLSMAEMAVVSARKTRLMEKAEAGDKKAQAALHLAQNPADFLSTVQIGITLIGILAGAFGGATFVEFLAARIRLYPPLAPYSRVISLSLVVLVITYLSLIVGELAPKRLALNQPERIAEVIASPMQRLLRLAAPLVKFLSASSHLLLKLFRMKDPVQAPVTQEEIKLLIAQGAQAGVFEYAEQDMVSGVFRLGDRRLGMLMTPRTEIEWLDLEDPLALNLEIVRRSVHSKFPAARNSLDHIEGVVLAKDLLARCLADSLSELPVLPLEMSAFVPENTPALRALDIFRKTGSPMVLVIDEFGGLQGLVTVNDLLEAIVGDMPSEGQLEEPGLVQREDGSWLVDGLLPVDDFMEAFNLTELPGQEKGYYQTLGGFIMSYLGRIPGAGDHFDWQGLQFEVVDMDGLRVDKVLFRAPPTISPNTAQQE